MKFVLIALVLFSSFSAHAGRDELPPNFEHPGFNDPCWPSNNMPGCPGYVDPFPSEPTPIRGVHYCYVRSASGKLYGPGPESRSKAQAKSAAVSLCQKKTRSACRVAYCRLE